MNRIALNLETERLELFDVCDCTKDDGIDYIILDFVNDAIKVISNDNTVIAYHIVRDNICQIIA